MATDELVHLIDLSLGVEPHGVVNFNYLHGLLHGIVQRLVDIESMPRRPATSKSTSKGRGAPAAVPGAKSLPDTRIAKRGMSRPTGVGKDGTGRVGKDGAVGIGKGGAVGVGKEGTDGVGGKDSPGPGVKAGEAKDGATKGQAREGEGREAGEGVSSAERGVKRQVSTRGEAAGGDGITTQDEREQFDGEDEQTSDRSVSDGDSGTSLFDPRRGSSPRQTGTVSRPRLVTAANDLGALDRKLQDLELRVQTMESLPDMLEKITVDPSATPVHDMWNFTKLDKRLNATEEGLGKTSILVDDLLGELQALKNRMNDSDELGRRLSEQLSGEIDSIHGKLGDLESAQAMPVSTEGLGEEAASFMQNLNAKIAQLQAEINSLKNQVADTDMTKLVTTDTLNEALSDALKDHDTLIQKNESSILAQKESLLKLEKDLSESSVAADKMTGKVEWLEEELNKLNKLQDEMKTSLMDKVSASDIASLMPTSSDSDEAASLMPKLLALQTKLHGMEAQIGAVPQDIQDQISTLRQGLDSQNEQLGLLTTDLRALESKQSPESQAKLDDLGSQLAQLRERLNELDRAVNALSDHMSSAMGGRPENEPMEVDADKYVDTNSFNVVQGLLAQLQQEHERLMGTAAHLSHELDVNKEHVKSLYDGVDDLRHNKADRTQVEVEVREKADRRALDDKASRDWVDNTFERLDKEIREASSKMMGQEEALKQAVHQLNEDVDNKLDRMELQPLKDYFEKRLDHVRTLPKLQNLPQSSDDAAGIKKPLRFACLSCDKPVEMKQLGIVQTLPTVSTFPGTRTFRPYTTYELEVIRKHQKLLYPLPPLADLSRAARSAGGSHTLTRPHQRFRLAPFGGSSYYSTPEPYTMSSKSSPLVFEETDIIGQDGQIYKGRVTRRHKGFPAARKGKGRPLTSPQKKPTSY